MNEEYNPSDPLAGDVDVTSTDGIENDSDIVSEAVASTDAVELKDLLSQATGRQFSDNESALKAVKDTFSYVGKVGKYTPVISKLEQAKGGEKNAIKFMEELTTQPEVQQPVQAPQADPNQFVSREEFDREMFFKDHPDLASHRELISSLQKGTGKPLAEVVEMDSFKQVFEKAKAYDEVEQSKSVLTSNPRLGQVTDKITQAREAQASGNQAQAAQNAVSAVLDAYDLS